MSAGNEKHLGILNSIAIETSSLIFVKCVSDFSYSFDKVSREEIEVWIENFEDQTIKDHWARQKEMKYPNFIFLYIMWYFIKQIVQSRAFQRENTEQKTVEKRIFRGEGATVAGILHDISQLSVFDGVSFLGVLIGAWMLTCPKTIILSSVDKTRDWQPNQEWLSDFFPLTLGKDIPPEEVKLLYILDYILYYSFEHIWAQNTYS
jgi:hypothetical protein